MTTAPQPPHAPRGFLIAHRAGNDLRRIASAVRSGARLVEADVWLHRGRLEVRHCKTAGPLPILWDFWRLHDPFAPRLQLSQLLDALDGHDIELMLDLKGRDRRTSQRVLAELDARPSLGAVTICARTWHFLDAFSTRPGTRRVWSVGTRRGLRRFVERFGSAPARVGGISIHADLLDAPTVRQLRGIADVVMTWPVNEPDRAHRLLGWGVHGLITDAPDEIASTVAHPLAQAVVA